MKKFHHKDTKNTKKKGHQEGKDEGKRPDT
jgi:hypothetical protein